MCFIHTKREKHLKLFGQKDYCSKLCRALTIEFEPISGLSLLITHYSPFS